MGNQKEFIASVDKLKKEFEFACEMAIHINADRLKHLEKIDELELRLKKVQGLFDIDELWDEYSEMIDDDIDSLSRYAGSIVMTKENFAKMIDKLKQNKQ